MLLSITITSDCFAQKQYGFKIGMANANQSWDYSAPGLDLGNESRAGMDIGFFYHWLSTGAFDIIPEIRYVQKGTSAEFIDTDTGDSVILEPRADYLSISPLFQKSFPVWIKPYIIAAPRFDILINTKSEQYFDTFEKLRAFDFGATIGAGFDFPFTDQIFFMTEFRYEPSFINAYSSAQLEVRNTTYSVLVGLYFTSGSW